MMTSAVYTGIHTYKFMAIVSCHKVCPRNTSSTFAPPPSVTDSRTAKNTSPKVASDTW